MSFLPEGFKPQKTQDMDQNEKLKGRAVCKLEKVSQDVGNWDNGDAKNQISFQWRIETKLDGNCHPNRVAFKKYNMLDTANKTGNETRAKLTTDLCTAGYDVDLSSEDAFYKSVALAEGTKANIVFGEFNNYQTVKIVEKFSEKKTVVKEEKKEAVPF